MEKDNSENAGIGISYEDKKAEALVKFKAQQEAEAVAKIENAGIGTSYQDKMAESLAKFKAQEEAAAAAKNNPVEADPAVVEEIAHVNDLTEDALDKKQQNY